MFEADAADESACSMEGPKTAFIFAEHHSISATPGRKQIQCTLEMFTVLS